MRALLINLFALLLTAVVGFVICRAMSIDPHVREMLFAGAITSIAADLALIPLMLTRRMQQPEVSQAGLVATVVHLFACAALGLAVTTLLKPPHAFLYWLLAFYWISLIGLCISIISAIRSAPIAVSK